MANLSSKVAFNTSFNPDTYWFNNMTGEVDSLLWAEELLAQTVVQMSDTDLNKYTTPLDQMLVSPQGGGKHKNAKEIIV